MLFLNSCRLVVWMGSMDLLEYSKLLQSLSFTFLHSHVIIPEMHVNLHTSYTCLSYTVQVFKG